MYLLGNVLPWWILLLIYIVYYGFFLLLIYAVVALVRAFTGRVISPIPWQEVLCALAGAVLAVALGSVLVGRFLLYTLDGLFALCFFGGAFLGAYLWYRYH